MLRYRQILAALVIPLLGMTLAYQGCGEPVHTEGSYLSAPSPAPESVAAFESSLYPILKNNCAVCHGFNQEPLFFSSDLEVTHNNMIALDLVDFSSPADSFIVPHIAAGHQGLPSELSSDIEEAIVAWAAAQPDVDVSDTPPVSSPSFADISAQILEPHCISCHGDGGSAQAHADLSRYASIVDNNLVRPYFPLESAVYNTVNSGTMPKGRNSLSRDQIDLLFLWIQQGARQD